MADEADGRRQAIADEMTPPNDDEPGLTSMDAEGDDGQVFGG